MAALTKLARVIICHRGRLLAIDHAGGGERLGLPGGHVEPGEPPMAAAARELREETGLRAAELHPVGVVAEPGRLTYLYVGHATGRLRGSAEGRPRWATAADLRQGHYGPFHVAALRAIE